MSEGHARLGPSNHRWPKCAGSVREEAAYPDVPGEAAIDGTGSHLLLEMCLLNGVRAEVYDGQIIGTNHPDNLGGWLVSIERIERVQMCLDYISTTVQRLRVEFPGAEIKVEAESTANPGSMFGRDDWWGTCDITITVIDGQNDRLLYLEVADYKDGRGWVHANDNSQLQSYLFGKLVPFLTRTGGTVHPIRPIDLVPCKMTIVQPKTNPVVRSQTVTVSDIIAAAYPLAEAARRTDDPDAPLTHGKHCRWCKHKDNCTAEAEQSLEVMKNMSTDIVATDGKSLFELISQTNVDVKSLTENQLAELADAEPGIIAVFSKIKTEIESRIDAGTHVPGYAKLPGNKSRVWNDTEENIAKMLRARKLKKDQIYPATLISPAQVLKLKDLTAEQKERIEKEYITEKAGKLSLKQVARTEQTAELLFADIPTSLFDESVVQSSTDEVSFI